MEPQALWRADETLGEVRVDDWPNPPRVYKTVMMHTHSFVGSIIIEGSIVENPQEDDWVEVGTEVFTHFALTDERERNRVINSRDRFVLMRARVERVHGRVDRILVA